MNELERIQKMIKDSGLSRYQISERTKISQAALSKIMLGKIKKPNISTIQTLEKFFEEYRNQGARTLIEVEQLNREPEKIGDNHFLTVGTTKFMIVPLIEQDAHADFVNHYNVHGFLEDLPKHAFPVDKFHKGKYYAFRVAGDGMFNGTNESIENNSVVTAREIQKSLWNSRFTFSQYNNFVIIHKEGVLVKQIIDLNTTEGKFTCKSLNPDKEKFPDLEIFLNEVNMILNIVQTCHQK